MQAEASKALKREVRKVCLAMRSLEHTLLRVIATNGSGRGTSHGRRAIQVSPKRRASLVLQGRYMGFMRQLKPRQKSLVKGLKASKGIQAAIARARSFAQKD